MPPETNKARAALMNRVNDIPIHQWTGTERDSDMRDFMYALIEGRFDTRLTGTEMEMTPVKWPQGGPECTLEYHCDTTAGKLDSSIYDLIVFFTASPDSVHDIVVVRIAQSVLYIQLKITVGSQGDKCFQGLSLAGDAIFSTGDHVFGRPYLCRAFTDEMKAYLLENTRLINNTTMIKVIQLMTTDDPLHESHDLMLI